MKHEKPLSLTIDFEENKFLPLLFGDQDQNITYIEHYLDITIKARGNHVILVGESSVVYLAEKVMKKLYDRLKKGNLIYKSDVEALLKIHAPSSELKGIIFDPNIEVSIPTRGKVVLPRTPRQSQYIEVIQHHDLVFGIGPAGTGKTYLAVASAVAALLSGQVSRIILSRPAVEAGEKLGFLPGDLREKVDPYLRPLFDALYDMLASEQVTKRLATNEIEIAPLAFMRGRTLSRAFIILDEAQNTTPAQMKMFLTRLGEGSKMVITGDVTQIDLPNGNPSGLPHALEILKDIKEIGFTFFNDEDIVRHPLVTSIVKAYDKHQ